MLPDVLALSTGKFWFWTLLSSLLTLVGLYFAFRNLTRARLIEDTPTSRIRSAHQGYVELNGMAAAMPGEPIISPISKNACCWFRYRVERRGDKGWNRVRSGESDSLFLLRDDTGECIIDPEGADVNSNEKHVWYGSDSTPAVGMLDDLHPTAAAGAIIGINTMLNDMGGNYRYTEEIIYPGNDLYAIGLFSSFGEADHQAMRKDLIKARLSQWKEDHASLLKRFDRDGDGKIDLDEWEVARRTAKREVTAEQLKADVQPMHTLSKTPSDRRPFLISTDPEFRLVKRYRYLAIASICAFFICGSFAVWMLSSRFIF